MTFRGYLQKLELNGALTRITVPVSKSYEAAGILKKLEPQPALFSTIKEASFAVAGNLFGSKAAFASYFGIQPADVIPTLTRAIENRRPCEVVRYAPCQEIIDLDPDLDRLPILRHCEKDGGNYISAGVVITKHPKWGQNADFHRCMQIGHQEMAIRIFPRRHFDTFLKDQRRLEVAICVGLAPNILAAAATSVEFGLDEMEIANALSPVRVVKATSVDLLVPSEAEFVLEGFVSLDTQHAEGPFVDLTETYDVIRIQPVFHLQAVTHRKDAIWQALLPGGLEHKLLMGMPREPTIFRKVNQVVKCLDVHINPGGASWLHAIIKIDKRSEDDGRKAIQAAFEGHQSCKHVFVVDSDIDIYDPVSVEWAMATRFQGDRGLVIKDHEPGSSLDPSAEPETNLTTKIGFDLTKPLVTKGKEFSKAAFPDVDLQKFLMKP
jgi:UbiD family decarboxylase